MDRKPEAIFDVLYVGSKIESKLDDFSQSEIQFFTYLACLLSLYAGNPLSFWEYSYVKTKFDSPYSVDINQAWITLKNKNSIEQTAEEYFKVTDKGKDDIQFYISLNSFKKRVIYLDAACKTLSLIPVGYIKTAIRNEPVLKTARTSISRKFLLDTKSPATQSLYEQFGKLKQSLNQYNTHNLLIPAVVWIESLNVVKQEQNIA